VLTAIAGILLFASAWNSFLQGKEKNYISLVYLVLLLSGLFILYFQFNNLCQILKDVNSPEDQFSSKSVEDQKIPFNDLKNSQEKAFALLKGVFSKPDIKSIGEKLLKNLAQEFEIVQGIFFVLSPITQKFTFGASYALSFDSIPPDFAVGDGITGQALLDNKIIEIPNIPESYSPVISGLGKAKARYLYIIPLIHEKKSFGVIEISCFKEIEDNRILLLNQLMREGGLKLSSVLSTAMI